MAGRTTVPRLLDTQLLIWMAFTPEQLQSTLIPDLEDRQQRFFVSDVSLWEVAIKRSLNRPDFHFDAAVLRKNSNNRDLKSCRSKPSTAWPFNTCHGTTKISLIDC